MNSTKILVVDEMRKGLSLRWGAHGYDAWFSADVLSATAVLVKESLIWSFFDPGLPGGDGFVVMERLQNND